MEISRAIKELRAALALTQKEFAIACPLGLPTLQHLETGDKRPAPESLVALARTAYECGRLDLAEMFCIELPGVRENLLTPSWLQAQAAVVDRTEYPRYLHHRDGSTVIVNNRVEERLRRRNPDWARMPWPKDAVQA